MEFVKKNSHSVIKYQDSALTNN